MARLIDADALGNGIALYMAENAYLNDTPLGVLKMVADWVAEAPTVDAVEVVHGKWIPTNYKPHLYIKCSVCGYRTHIIFQGTKYCFNCGAKMDGDGNV